MSIWSQRRKAKNYQPPPPDPREGLEIRVARRICAIVYSQCTCHGHTNGKANVCEVMRTAAQHAMQEILS